MKKNPVLSVPMTSAFRARLDKVAAKQGLKTSPYARAVLEHALDQQWKVETKTVVGQTSKGPKEPGAR